MSLIEGTSSTNGATENDLLKTSLSNLEAIANKGTGYIKTQLTTCGYADWLPNESEDQEQVRRVFVMATNEAIRNKLDLAKVNTDKIQEKYLRQLLGIDESTSLCPAYFTSLQNIEKASSPLDMAEHINNLSAGLLKNLIQHQFEIKWNTPTGEPKKYTFHEFCDKANATELFKSYNLRRDHVKAMLYNECRRKNVVDLRAISTKWKLCPKVNIRIADGWKTLDAVSNTFTNCEDNFDWMDESIKTFIEENADVQTGNESELKRSLMKPVLYWAVLDDRDFKRGDNLQLKPIGKTQVYVGQSMRGIRQRWITDGGNHCEKMKKCLDNVSAMTTYDPLTLDGIQLIDARLTLAKVRGENTALFVMKTFGGDVEKAEIVLEDTKASLEQTERFRNNVRKKWIYEAKELISRTDNLISCHDKLVDLFEEARISDSKIETADAHADLNKARENHSKAKASLDEAEISLCNANATCEELTEVAERLHGELKKITDDNLNAKTNLDHAEKSHRQGKRVDGSKIIENNNNIEWKPTDMGYGMNFN